MKTKKELAEQRQGFITRAEALIALDELTDEQRKEAKELTKAIEDVDADIEFVKRSEERPGTPPPMDTGLTGDMHDLEAERGFSGMGEVLQTIALAGVRGSNGPDVDKRLLHHHEQVRAASGSNEAIPSDGGFLIPTEQSQEIMTDIHQQSQLASRCRRGTLSGNSIELLGVDETSRAAGSRWGGVQVYWADEANTVTATKPKFRKIKLTANKLVGIAYATEEMLEDQAALQTILAAAFPEEMAFVLDEAILRGDGSGKPIGILTSDALVTVSKETGQTADTVVSANVRKMRSRMMTQSRSNAVWFINQEVEPELETMFVAVGTGGSLVYMPANGISEDGFDRLYGKSIVPIEQASALGDVGDITFLDLNQYLLVDKGGVNSESSIHVRFLYGETAFRWTLRVDGQPLREKALTPARGTKTTSPFVTLEAR